MPGSSPTFLDLAASIDPKLARNINFPRRQVSSGVTALTNLDSLVDVDASGGVATVTLPDSTTVKKGMLFEIKKVDATANAVTINAFGGQTIDGSPVQVLSTQWSNLVVYSDGTNYKIFASIGTGGVVTDTNLALTSTGVTYTGGVEGFGAIADVTGVTINFNLAVAATVQFFCSGASLANPFIQGNYLGLAINVNGTDYYINGTGEQGFNSVGGGNVVVSGFTTGDAISGHLVLSLPAGPYTAKLRAFGNGYLESSALFPTKLTAVYPTVTGPMASAAALVKQETGPFAATVNPPNTNYAVVAGSTITVTLLASQTIAMTAYATFIDPGSDRDHGQIGIRVTSPGPVTTDYNGTEVNGGNDVNSSGASIDRAVTLAAGTHTFDLLTRNPDSATTYQYRGAFLTVVYNDTTAVAPTPEAATFVVHPTAGTGNFQTIDAAIAALPAEGGYILVREGTYTITSPIILPNKSIVIRGCGQGTILAPTPAGTLFKIADGLTTVRTYIIEDLQIQGNPAVAQTGFQLDDTNGYGNFELRNVNGTGLSKFVDWSKYDTTFTRQSCIFLYNSVFQAISGGSTLATAPNAAGSYLGAAAIRSSEASAFTSIVNAGVTYGWTANADADLWLSDSGQNFTALTQGIAMNGFLAENSIIYFYGTGSASFGGNGWGNSDFVRNCFVAAFDATTLALVDFLLNVNGSGITDSFFDIAINCTFIGDVVDCEFLDPIGGSAHPAIQLNNQKSVVTGNVIRNLTGAVTGWPQGGVKLSGAGTVRCFIHHNFFETTLVGATITETGGSDSNIINGNAGETNGTGLNITGASTTVNDAAKADAAANTTNALVTIVATVLNPKGLLGIGSVKNTGVTNSMDVKETFTDAFGTASTLTSTVTPGNYLPLDLGIAIGTGFPPYVSYKVEVIDTVAGNHTSYVSHFTSQGTTK